MNGTFGASTTITRGNLLQPYPQFTSVAGETYQGYSWYHSMQTRVSRRIAATNINATYTWAKNMLASECLNPADPMPSRAIVQADRRHRATVALIYQLPFGRRGRFLHNVSRRVDAVIGGWQISTMYIYQSGQPLSWGDVIFFGNPADIGNGPHTAEQWFNPNARFTKNSSSRHRITSAPGLSGSLTCAATH